VPRRPKHNKRGKTVLVLQFFVDSERPWTGLYVVQISGHYLTKSQKSDLDQDSDSKIGEGRRPDDGVVFGDCQIHRDGQ
jgi:hypothetical protein